MILTVQISFDVIFEWNAHEKRRDDYHVLSETVDIMVETNLA